jgi:ribonuclease D
VVRQRSQEGQVASELVATQAELSELVAAVRRGAEPGVRVARGWRRELVGAELEELLSGRRRVSVVDGGRLHLERA